mgnify:CR=1 FL=1
MRIIILLELVDHIIALAMYINGKVTVGELLIVTLLALVAGEMRMRI